MTFKEILNIPDDMDLTERNRLITEVFDESVENEDDLFLNQLLKNKTAKPVIVRAMRKDYFQGLNLGAKILDENLIVPSSMADSQESQNNAANITAKSEEE